MSEVERVVYIFGAGRGVLFREVSSVQGCSSRGVPLSYIPVISYFAFAGLCFRCPLSTDFSERPVSIVSLTFSQYRPHNQVVCVCVCACVCV